tara:strand:+ start:575 stop:856 length:282 start_codon:yes stop_codon:yes gene_type:complete
LERLPPPSDLRPTLETFRPFLPPPPLSERFRFGCAFVLDAARCDAAWTRPPLPSAAGLWRIGIAAFLWRFHIRIDSIMLDDPPGPARPSLAPA